MIFSRIPWIKNRKKLIFRASTDLLIYILFFRNYESIFLTIFISLSWCLSNYIIGLYHNKINEFNFKSKLTITIKKFFISLLIISVIINSLSLFNFLNSSFFSLFINITLINIFSFILQKIYSTYFTRNTKKEDRWNFIGEEIIFVKLKKFLVEEINLNIKISHLKKFNKDIKSVGYIIENIKLLNNKDQIFLLNQSIEGNVILNIIEWCEITLGRIPADLISGGDLIKIDFSSQLGSFQFRLKRIGDIFFSLILLTFSLPVLIISALLIYLEDKGPIFYFQTRSGLMNKNFQIIKLRTMFINSERNGPQWSSQNDKRVTKIGSLLRKYRIDELPQLITVIKGDMSLIGPRPERPEIDLKLLKKLNNYSLRYLAKPGLSGWAQVNYPYGASIDDSKIKLSYDLFYIKNFTVLFDLLIFFKTIKLVLNAEGSIPKAKQ